jgi:hypothetical protein
MNVIIAAKDVCKEGVWKMWLDISQLSTNFRLFLIVNTLPPKGESCVPSYLGNALDT